MGILNKFKKLFSRKEEEQECKNVETNNEEVCKVKSIESLVEYLMNKKDIFFRAIRIWRRPSCEYDGITRGIDDAIRLVDRYKNMEFNNGLKEIRNAITTGKHLEVRYPAPYDRNMPFWNRSYCSGVGAVLGWISEYETK